MAFEVGAITAKIELDNSGFMRNLRGVKQAAKDFQRSFRIMFQSLRRGRWGRAKIAAFRTGINAAKLAVRTFTLSLRGAMKVFTKFTVLLGRMTRGLLGLPGKLIGAFANLQTVVMAFAAHQLVGRAQEIETLGRAFDNLTKSVDGTADSMLRGLRRATRGTVSDLELMRTTNNAVLLKVVQSEEQFVELAGAARQLGRAVGRDTVAALNDLSIGIGRQSRLILDNLGIIVRTEKANIKYARSLRKSVSELTDYERRLAFSAATMDAVRKKLKQLGEDVPTLTDAFGAFGAEIQNITNNFAAILVGFEFPQKLLDLAKAVRPLMRGLSTAAAFFFTKIGKMIDVMLDPLYDEKNPSSVWSKILDAAMAVIATIGSLLLVTINHVLLDIAPKVLELGFHLINALVARLAVRLRDWWSIWSETGTNEAVLRKVANELPGALRDIEKAGPEATTRMKTGTLGSGKMVASLERVPPRREQVAQTFVSDGVLALMERYEFPAETWIALEELAKRGGQGHAAEIQRMSEGGLKEYFEGFKGDDAKAHVMDLAQRFPDVFQGVIQKMNDAVKEGKATLRPYWNPASEQFMMTGGKTLEEQGKAFVETGGMFGWGSKAAIKASALSLGESILDFAKDGARTVGDGMTKVAEAAMGPTRGAALAAIAADAMSGAVNLFKFSFQSDLVELRALEEQVLDTLKPYARIADKAHNRLLQMVAEGRAKEAVDTFAGRTGITGQKGGTFGRLQRALTGRTPSVDAAHTRANLGRITQQQLGGTMPPGIDDPSSKDEKTATGQLELMIRLQRAVVIGANEVGKAILQYLKPNYLQEDEFTQMTTKISTPLGNQLKEMKVFGELGLAYSGVGTTLRNVGVVFEEFEKLRATNRLSPEQIEEVESYKKEWEEMGGIWIMAKSAAEGVLHQIRYINEETQKDTLREYFEPLTKLGDEGREALEARPEFKILDQLKTDMRDLKKGAYEGMSEQAKEAMGAIDPRLFGSSKGPSYRGEKIGSEQERQAAMAEAMAQAKKHMNEYLDMLEKKGGPILNATKDRIHNLITFESQLKIEQAKAKLEELFRDMAEFQGVSVLDDDTKARIKKQFDKEEDLTDQEKGVEFIKDTGEQFGDSIFGGMADALNRGESLSQLWVNATAQIWTDAMDRMVGSLSKKFGTLMGGLFEKTGLGEMGGQIGMDILGLGIGIIQASENRRDQTIEEFEETVNSSEAVRGVVAGPTNVAISQMGDSLKSAFITTELLLERIAISIEAGGMGGGTGDLNMGPNLSNSTTS